MNFHHPPPNPHRSPGISTYFNRKSNGSKGESVTNAEQRAKTTSRRTGAFATLSNLLRPKGIGAPARRRIRLTFAVACRRTRLTIAAACASLIAAGALLGGSALSVAFAADTCTNEAFRQGASANLPDCRAYEMVTPPFKDGQPVGMMRAATDGSRLIGVSDGIFAGATDGVAGVGTPYMFERSATGWTTTPLTRPPATDISVSVIPGDTSAVSADLRSTLTLGPPPSSPESHYFLRQPDGSYIDIGPETPPADGQSQNSFAFNGGSSDLSRFVFSINGQYWPGDPTEPGRGENSLYEYSGTGNSAPTLVGVSGGSGSTNLISQCQTEIGGPRSAYNAISNDGATIFFTADGLDSNAGSGCTGSAPPVDQLFARINESQTVAISQRSPADCTTSACLNSPASGALFEGASQDGSKAFFTSTQQLLDNATEDSTSGDTAVPDAGSGSGCNGASDPGCNLYEYDFSNPSGHNLLLVSSGSATPDVEGVARISQDGSHIYFVARGVLTTSPNNFGQTAQSGSDNLYVFERDAQFPAGKTSFIATLSPSDSGVWSASDSRPVQATPDGRFLVFQSQAQLTPDDTSSAEQVFRYDAQTGDLIRVSIGNDGFNDNGNTNVDNATIPNPGFPNSDAGAAPQFLAMSNDGAYVFFQSSDGLTPHAQNDVPIDSNGDKAMNVYEFHDGHVYLISDGSDSVTTRGGSAVHLLGTDNSGQNVFFTTADQLISQDTDTQQDVYDARIDGGIPSPTSATPCSGDTCKPPPSGSPPEQTPGSSALSGPGNLHRTKCKKGFVRKHGKCVKKHHKRRHHKRAGSNRGGQR